MWVWFVLVLGLSVSPLSLLFLLVLVLFFVSILLVFTLSGYFFSYLIFLLFMSGLITMLMYFCSVILGEKFVAFLDFGLFMGFLVFLASSGHQFDVEVNLSKFFYFELSGLAKYLVYPFGLYSLFFIGYLLCCLVVVFEVVKKCSGPLRMKT